MKCLTSFATLGLLLLAGCSGESTIGPTTEWVDESGAATDLVQTSRGPQHCDWESATLLGVDQQVVPPAPEGYPTSTFARDVDGVLPSREVHGELDLDATVPAGAVETGYTTTTGIALLIDPQDPDSVYLHSDQVTERWPRADVGCD